MKTNKFQQFAKKGNRADIVTNNAVVYTRVSTKEQADSNASLETQLKYCKEYAKRKGLNIIEYFGGTYESAKNDERVEFNKMLKFLQRRKNISYVLVYSYDRFSRTGANAAYISSNLKKKGIHTISVSQEVDTSKPSGAFQENLYYMFSQFDNEMRRDKTVTGMREKLRNGYWCSVPPFGYINTNKGAPADKSNIILNDKGKMVVKVFKWIYKYSWSLERASLETKKEGIYISAKRLSEILRNPFYAGFITSSIIPNEIYEGKHERAISHQIFKTVNEILDGKTISRKGIKMRNHEEIPLKGLLICEDCGKKMTGYKASKNQKFYYKCNTKGCKNNQRADELHESFKELLKYFYVDKKFIEPLKLRIKDKFDSLNEASNEKRKKLTASLTTIERKIENTNMKFIDDKIDETVYNTYLSKFKKEKEEILKELDNPFIKLSNLEKFTEYTIKITRNLLKLWNSPDFNEKVALQNVVFPEGILYNRDKGTYRTRRVNILFSVNYLLSSEYKQKKQSGKLILNKNSAFVPGAGIEPARPNGHWILSPARLPIPPPGQP